MRTVRNSLLERVPLMLPEPGEALAWRECDSWEVQMTFQMYSRIVPVSEEQGPASLELEAA